MLLLHCTQKVQTWLKINKANLVDPEIPVHVANDWCIKHKICDRLHQKCNSYGIN
jgi:hypothetical protein